jgi:hypothetical protein
MREFCLSTPETIPENACATTVAHAHPEQIAPNSYGVYRMLIVEF